MSNPSRPLETKAPLTDDKTAEPPLIKYAIDRRCTECAACVTRCPTQSIFLGVGQYVIDRDTCHGCAVCVIFCPVNAIHPIGHADEKRQTGHQTTAKPKH